MNTLTQYELVLTGGILLILTCMMTGLSALLTQNHIVGRLLARSTGSLAIVAIAAIIFASLTLENIP